MAATVCGGTLCRAFSPRTFGGPYLGLRPRLVYCALSALGHEWCARGVGLVAAKTGMMVAVAVARLGAVARLVAATAMVALVPAMWAQTMTVARGDVTVMVEPYAENV